MTLAVRRRESRGEGSGECRPAVDSDSRGRQRRRRAARDRGWHARGSRRRDGRPRGRIFRRATSSRSRESRSIRPPSSMASRSASRARPSERGDWVHSHNLRTSLSGLLEYTYAPNGDPPRRRPGSRCRRSSATSERTASVGTRNELWVLNTVGCVNHAAERIAKQAAERYAGRDRRHSRLRASIWMQPARRRFKEYASCSRRSAPPSRTPAAC